MKNQNKRISKFSKKRKSKLSIQMLYPGLVGRRFL